LLSDWDTKPELSHQEDVPYQSHLCRTTGPSARCPITTARGGTFQGTCDYARAETPAVAGPPARIIGNIAQDLQIQLEDPYGMGTLMTWIVVQVVAPAACCQTVRVPL